MVKPEKNSEILNTEILTTDSVFLEKESGNFSNNDTEREKKKSDKEKEMEKEEEDYSYLYTLKKDSRDLLEHRAEWKDDFEKVKRDASFSSDFISLSASVSEISKKAKNTSFMKKKKTASTPQSYANKKASSESLDLEKTSDSTQHIKTKESSDFLSLTTANITSSVCITSQTQPVIQSPGEKKQSTTSYDFISFSSSGRNSKEAGEKQDKVPRETCGIADVQSKDEKVNNADAANTTKTSEDGIFVSQTSTNPLFLLDRSGNGAGKTSQTPLPSLTSGQSLNPETKKVSMKQDEILGTGDLKPSRDKKELDIISLDAAARTKHKTKALKRKLDQEEGFISFKYTEANIKTLVSNPNKKRKKKKNK